jgi:hypothetical protein
MLRKAWVVLGVAWIMITLISLALPAVSFADPNEPDGQNNDGQMNEHTD